MQIYCTKDNELMEAYDIVFNSDRTFVYRFNKITGELWRLDLNYFNPTVDHWIKVKEEANE